MKTLFLNPHIGNEDKYIREGRCMQKASSWVTLWPPVGLAVLASIAQDKGPISLIDGNVESMNFEELLTAIKEFAPQLIVVSTGFPSIDSDMALVHRIKQAYPSAKILAFGVYFTLLEKKGFVDCPQSLDMAIVGEPEKTFEELLHSMNTNEDDYGHIKGLIYRDSSGIFVTHPRPLIEDLDTIPVPDRSIMKTDMYRLPHNNKPFTLINSARGCPYKCIYCIVSPYYGKRVRRHSLNYILDEIRECVQKYNINEILFWEEAFTMDRNNVMNFCDAICQENFSISWAATTRVDCLDEEILIKMKKAGCYLLGLGIESGNQIILDNAKKNITLEQIENAVALCKKARIKTMGHFIFGLPGETRDTANKTIKFMKRLGLDYMQSYCAVPYPKTELGELASKNNWICAQKWSEYDFGGDSILSTDTMSPEEVSGFRRRAFRVFYFRLSSIGKILREIRVCRLFKLLTFIKWINFKKRR